MLKLINKIFLVLLIFIFNNLEVRGNLGKQLTDYDYEDIRELSRLCHVAYGNSSSYFEKLKELGWDIEFLKANDFLPSYGIKAYNGPLVAIVYAGTDVIGNLSALLADIDVVRLDSKEVFPKLPFQATLHRGFANYYKPIYSSHGLIHLDNLDYDQKLIFAGHSLGGALAQLNAIQVLEGIQGRNDQYSQNFCSILTLGSPAFLDKPLAAYLDTHFTGSSHLRMRFKKDPIAKYTRGKPGSLFDIQSSSSGRGAFVHAGLKVRLPGKGMFSHQCDSYIQCIDEKPQVLQHFWPFLSREASIFDLPNPEYRENFTLSSEQIKLIR